MKIYTRGGDLGETSLWGGRRVSKADLQVQAYGNVDELNSFVGLLLAQQTVSSHGEAKTLVAIQNHLFSVGSMLAQDPGRERKRSDFELDATAEQQLESSIDNMEKDLPALKNFILPGGSENASRAHVCRTVCRRAERSVVLLAAEIEVDPVLIRYLNRLSDYFFVLARHLCLQDGVSEIPWIPAAK